MVKREGRVYARSYVLRVCKSCPECCCALCRKVWKRVCVMWLARKLTYVKEWRHQQEAHFHTHSFTGYSQIFHTIPAGDSWQTHDNFLSVLQMVVFTATVCGYGYSLVLFHTQVVWQSLHDSHKCSKLFVLHVRLESKCRFAKCRVCTWHAFIVMHKKFTNDTICGQFEDMQKTIATNHTELLPQGWKQDHKLESLQWRHTPHCFMGPEWHTYWVCYPVCHCPQGS